MTKPRKHNITDREEVRIQAGIALDPDNPEWSEADFRKAKPFGELFPKLGEAIKRSRGRPALERPRKQISIRLDPDVIDKFKATGPRWQSKINEVLKRAKVSRRDG